MSSMVSEFIIGPALRQVRRFSRSSTTTETETTYAAANDRARESPAIHEDATSETEEDSYFRDEGNETSSPSVSSQSSATPNLVHDYSRPTASNIAHNDHSTSSRDVAPELSVVDQSDIAVPNNAMSQLGFTDRPTPFVSATENAITFTDTPASAASSVPAGQKKTLPEDDGMGNLRRRIQDIQGSDLPPDEKARLMHMLLMEGYTKSHIVVQSSRPLTHTNPVSFEQVQTQGPLETLNKFWQSPFGDSVPANKFILTEEDIKPTFAPLKPDEEGSEYRALGCEHYKRNVKMQCSICGRWYNCRFCHDNVEDHTLIRKETKNMLCMFCGTAQRAGEVCTNCGESAASYYCHICKLWDNDPDKNIYHCNDCGICRIGRGLGKDFFHCKRCCACLAISIENDHKCIERSLDCDCPICGEYMFNSPRAVCFMKCGHALHRDCYDEHIKSAYKCPICNKSVVNMETQFRNLDMAIQTQPMPERFQDTRAVILCNDCSARTTVKYHWLGLKCAVCQSYNTSELQILGVEAEVGTAEIATMNVSDTRLPESAANTGTLETLNPAAASSARDIPQRRRHSSNFMQLSTENIEGDGHHGIGSYVVQNRLARSVSPLPTITPARSAGSPQAGNEDLEEEDYLVGFWGRAPRSLTSNEDLQDQHNADIESLSSLGDEMEEDDSEGEEEQINLFGHR